MTSFPGCIGKGCGSAKLPVPTHNGPASEGPAIEARKLIQTRFARTRLPTKAEVGCTVSSGNYLEAGETFPWVRG